MRIRVRRLALLLCCLGSLGDIASACGGDFPEIRGYIPSRRLGMGLGIAFRGGHFTASPPQLESFILKAVEGGPAVSKPSWTTSVHEGRLSLMVHAVPLKKVLNKIARQSGLSIAVAPSIDEKVSATFEGLPLEEGLRQLLKGHNVIFLYAQSEGSRTRRIFLTAVKVLPKGAEDRRRADEGEEPKRRVEESSEETDLAHRKQAVEALEASGQIETIEPLLEALQDEDVDIRRTALEIFQRLRVSSSPEMFPSKALVEVAVQDDNPRMRMAALEVLREVALESADPQALEGLEQALRDSDPDVQTWAIQLLDGLNPKP
jgi:hypothetical protein